ncbi:MAG TPA: serine hydrolase [Polyangiaceae bacterium]
MTRPNEADAARTPWSKPDNLAPRQWWVIGPFPNGLGPDGRRRLGLDHDFLVELGGEAEARITRATVVSQLEARAASLDVAGMLDFRAMFQTDTDLKVAYAYAEWDVAAAAEAHAVFGSDDGARVFVNGREVHRLVTPARSVEPCNDRFDFALRAGQNRMLVKIENAYGEWGFALRIADPAGRDRLRAYELRRQLDSLDLGPAQGDFRIDGSFPAIVFRRAEAARLVFGDQPIRARWFDSQTNEVREPDGPGRYVAVVEATTLDGFTMRRMLTFVAPDPSRTLPSFPVPPLGEPPRAVGWPAVDRSLDEREELEVSRHMTRAAAQYSKTEGGAILLAALVDPATAAPDEPGWLASGFVRSLEHQLRVRLKIEGRAARPFPTPQPSAPARPEIRVGSEPDAGIARGTSAELSAFSREWATEDPNGFVALAMRRGVVFFHEGFGGFQAKSLFAPASIGKAIAGLLFGRAVDQGLFDFDEPIGRTLGDWNDHQTGKVTFRNCFHHLVGFSDHAARGGLFNAYLDNALFVEDAVFEKPRVKHRYNGDSYNLVGKALEVATGSSVVRLLFEHLQRPFGESVTQFDLGAGNGFTARYLAKVGHMILEDGQYGRYRLFAPGFLAKLRPMQVAAFAPDLEDKSLEWGIGQTWMIDPSGPRERGALGPNVIGHGASSGSIWRVDLDHQVVVVIGRNGFVDPVVNGRRAAGFMQILAKGLLPSNSL